MDLQQVQEENEMLNQQFEETKVESANEWNAIEEVENECEEVRIFFKIFDRPIHSAFLKLLIRNQL